MASRSVRSPTVNVKYASTAVELELADLDTTPQEPELLSIDELLHKAGGFGKYQRELLGTISFAYVVLAVVSMHPVYLLPLCKDDFDLSTVQEGLISSGFFLGYFVGLLFFGWMGDRHGRRAQVFWGSCFAVIPGAAVFFSPNYLLLLMLRAVAGFGTAGVATGCVVLIVEWVPGEHRATVKGVLSICWCIGNLMLSLAAWILGPVLGYGWRALVLTIVPGLIAPLMMHRCCPESPRYYVACGQLDKAMMLIQLAADRNGVALQPGCCAVAPPKDTGHKASNVGVLKQLFQFSMLFTLANVSFLFFATGICYYGIAFGDQVRSTSNLYTSALLGALVEAPAYIFMVPAANRLGRRKMFSSAMAVLSVSLYVVGFSTQVVPDTMPKILKTVAALVGRCASSAVSAIIYIIAAEQFPSSLRSAGMGFSSGCSRVGAMIAPMAMEDLPASVLWFATLSILAAVASSRLRETAGQELQDTAAGIDSACELSKRAKEGQEQSKSKGHVEKLSFLDHPEPLSVDAPCASVIGVPDPDLIREVDDVARA